MTKENFEKYDKTQDVYCECCKTNKPVTSFIYNNIRTNTRNASRCKTCNWFYKNHNGLVPKMEGFLEHEIIKTVEFILEDEDIFINTLADRLSRSINDLINLIYQLNLKNVSLSIKIPCAYCGKEVESKLSIYLNNKNIYCSRECYWKHKPTTALHGEDSPYYNRITTACTNCGKELKIIPNRFNSTNSYGDNHNFCSHKCYWEYRSKYYVAEKASMHNYKYTDEQKENNRIRLLDRLKDDNRLETKIQSVIDDLLFKNGIDFEREKVFDYYAVDNYLSNCNGIIEVMGDYWHTSPLVYNANGRSINEIQQKQLHRDKVKHSYISNHYSIPILYLWEEDIKNNSGMCFELIKKYIQNNRLIENYHSFNWELINGELKLKETLTVPYQDMSVNEYRNLIKRKAG